MKELRQLPHFNFCLQKQKLGTGAPHPGEQASHSGHLHAATGAGRGRWPSTVAEPSLLLIPVTSGSSWLQAAAGPYCSATRSPPAPN
jgi:hypothetical protein